MSPEASEGHLQSRQFGALDMPARLLKEIESMTAIFVKDIMQTEVVTLSAADSLGIADDIMRLGRIRHMPVVAEDGVVGIVSQRDLFLASVSSALRFRPSAEREWLAKIRVEEILSHPVHTATPEMPIIEAVNLMLSKRIGCLPVVENDKLVGLLSETDCLRLLATTLEIEAKATLLN
jgi:CBS domain-containing protein